MSDSPAYRAILTYLVNHATIDDGATVNDIVDATKISRPTVYRIVADKRNGTVGDETVSGGIFIAPTSMRINNGRPAKTYYADLTRIENKKELNSLAVDRVPLPAVFHTYEVTGRHLTQAMREILQRKQSTSHIVQDSTSSLAQQLASIFGTHTDMFEDALKEYQLVASLTDRMQQASKEAQATGTVDKELTNEWREGVLTGAKRLATLLTLFEYVVQHPNFDGHPERMFEESATKVDIGIPAIKERK